MDFRLGKKHKMNAHWEAFETTIEDTPAWILFNETAGRELRGLDLPNLLRVQAEYDASAGLLPAPREEDRLSDLENELEDWIGALGGRYVGQVTAAGLRTMFFYLSCGAEEAENLIRRIALRKDMSLGMKMQPDPKNRVYYELLLPTADERRRMRDMAAIAELRARGDSLAEPRPVEHSASFANRHQAIAFANWARKNRFVVDGIRSPAAADGHFVLQFHRNVPPLPEAIDADTAAISRMAGQLGGAYEGWRAQARLAKAG